MNSQPAPWRGLDELLDRCSDDQLRLHRLAVPAARRRRALGLPVPADFVRAELTAAGVLLAAPAVLARVRNVVTGPLLLHKGPEIAATYPDPAMRPFGDLDLLVPDPAGAQRELIAAGFREIGAAERFVGIHHLRPLVWEGLPLRVEIHGHPKWPAGLVAPSFSELLETARPSATGVDGVLAVEPCRHALLVAAHAWAHEPLRRLLDLLDVAAVGDGLVPAEIDAVARDWEIGRLWRTVAGAAEAIFSTPPRRRTLALSTWARHLPAAQERTVLGSHLQRLLADFWALPPGRAARVACTRLYDDLLPAQDETWPEKLERSRLALRRALRPRAEHERLLGAGAERLRRRA